MDLALRGCAISGVERAFSDSGFRVSVSVEVVFLRCCEVAAWGGSEKRSSFHGNSAPSQLSSTQLLEELRFGGCLDSRFGLSGFCECRGCVRRPRRSYITLRFALEGSCAGHFFPSLWHSSYPLQFVIFSEYL